MSMTIGNFASSSGVGVETVRYYQRRGLMKPPERAPGSGMGSGIRRYDDEDVRRLRFIRAAQTAGFTLEQIRELLALDSSHDHARARSLAQERVAALDAKIEELSAARDSLRRLARACSAASGEPCPIIEAFQTTQ